MTKNQMRGGKRMSRSKTLKFILAFLVINIKSVQRCQSLKLNPVQPLPLLPLTEEIGSMMESFQQAKEFIQAVRNDLFKEYIDGGNVGEIHLPPDDIRTVGAIKTLRTVSNRWRTVEHKYMNMVSNNMENATLFNESLDHLAEIKLLLANVYLDTNAPELAIEEYEAACPILMSLQHNFKSFDIFGWIDCSSKLSNLYIKNRKYDAAITLGESLLAKMPWLSSLADYSNSEFTSSSTSIDFLDESVDELNGEAGITGALTAAGTVSVDAQGGMEVETPTPSSSSSSRANNEVLAIVRRFSEFTKKEKQMLSDETSKTWLMAERLRIDLRQAVKEFAFRDGRSDLQKEIYDSAEKFVKSMLKGFLELTPDQFDVSSYMPRNANALTFTDIYPNLDDRDVIREDTQEVFERIKSILFSQLKREGFLYLNTMKGVIDKGRNYVPAAKIKAKEFENEASLKSHTSPKGFNSVIDVLDLFHYYQSEAKKHSEAQANDDKRPSSGAFRKIGADDKANSPGSKSKSKRTIDSSSTATANVTDNEMAEVEPWNVWQFLCNEWFFYIAIGLVALLTSHDRGHPNTAKPRSNARYIKAIPNKAEKGENADTTKNSVISLAVEKCKNRMKIGVRNIQLIWSFVTTLIHATVVTAGTRLKAFLKLSGVREEGPLGIDIVTDDLLTGLNENRNVNTNSPKKNATIPKNQKGKRNTNNKRFSPAGDNSRRDQAGLLTTEAFPVPVSSSVEPRFGLSSGDYADDDDFLGIDEGEWITMDHQKPKSPHNSRIESNNNSSGSAKSVKSKLTTSAFVNSKLSTNASSSTGTPKKGEKKALSTSIITAHTNAAVAKSSNGLSSAVKTSDEKISHASVTAKDKGNDKDGDDSDANSSDGMGSTSDESDDTPVQNPMPRTRSPSIERPQDITIATSPARTSHGGQQDNNNPKEVIAANYEYDSLEPQNKTEKLRQLLSMSTSSSSGGDVVSDKSSPSENQDDVGIPLSSASVTPLMQIVMVPQSDGTGMPMMLGVDGLYYPVPRGVFPNQPYFAGTLPPHQRTEMVDRIRAQIEFYFSPQNLVRDTYLKSLMNHEGFVRIEQIMPFNRIKQLMADPYMVLEAVQTSNQLDIDEVWAVKTAKGDATATRAINPSLIAATKIRCLNEPTKWVPSRMS